MAPRSASATGAPGLDTPEPDTSEHGTFEPEALRVARVLRDQIVDGERGPGSRLVERELADELGVSRVPVREALRALVAEGLVTPRPRSWAVVRTFSPDDVAHLLEVRAALEVLAARRAAERAAPQDLTALADALAREEQAAARDDATAARRAAADFHEALLAAAGNSVLDELTAVTASRSRWLLGQHEDLAGMAGEHRHLLDAIRAGDADEAAHQVAAHLETSRRALTARRAAAD
ncbi:GntR family transcriptional regulator [Cellulosimicrobium protaetiae]|uniref:GntR family transcriptional regulator n=1 Tax=Cellulosimicrobium protaetiae TaxID=2587808 RepID=A0A6M5UEF2_9MICO|nr:GntR family transcriptional regulator [Cellulosimicrobium protaetiae]QJW36394.1 GntR family transcriptional regulator [Cellulosimicrobium protaetiae]